MKPASFTTQFGEVFTANFNKANNGWYVDKNGNSHEFVPYSRSFNVNGSDRMATTSAEALRIGILMIELAEDAEVHFFKSHPELNP